MSLGKILIIDDDESTRRLLGKVLCEEGYSCVIASNGQDAAQMVSQQEFDIALLDMKMPGMSGLDALRVLRENHPNLCVIVVTGVNDEETIADTLRLGAYDYITKPFRLEELLTMVVEVLKSIRECQ